MKLTCLTLFLALGLVSGKPGLSERSASEHSKVDSGAEKKDDKDWTVKGGKKYLVVLEEKNRLDAIKHCIGEGGKLFEPKSEEENTAVNAIAKEKGAKNIWIGVHDKSKEGNFEYQSDSSKCKFTKWAAKKPDNVKTCSNDEDCVEMQENGEWNDINAEEKRQFVCEAQCHEEGWKKLKFGKCKQYFLASAKKSHADAVADCKAKGAILFEPKSELTNTWVAELALEEGISGYWIGITDRKFEGKFVYQSDSKSIGFHWWDRRQPNNRRNNCDQDEDCVYASNGEGEWQDLCCKKEHSYVCEKPATHCSHEEHCIPEKKNLGDSINVKREKMSTVETTTKAQKLETAALKTAMDYQKEKLDSQVTSLTEQKAALDSVNEATAKHHQAIEDLKKCLEKVEKSRDEQKATIDKLNTVTAKVATATNELKDATTKQKIAFDKLKTVTDTQHKAIEAAENASKMVVNYWTILKACEDAVRKKNGHVSDVKAYKAY